MESKSMIWDGCHCAPCGHHKGEIQGYKMECCCCCCCSYCGGHRKGKIRERSIACWNCRDCRKHQNGCSSKVLQRITIVASIMSGFACGIFSAMVFHRLNCTKLCILGPYRDGIEDFLLPVQGVLIPGWILSCMLFCWTTIGFMTGLAHKGNHSVIGVSMAATLSSLWYWAHMGALVEEEFLIVFPVTLSLIQTLCIMHSLAVGWIRRSPYWRAQKAGDPKSRLNFHGKDTQDCQKLLLDCHWKDTQDCEKGEEKCFEAAFD